MANNFSERTVLLVLEIQYCTWPLARRRKKKKKVDEGNEGKVMMECKFNGGGKTFQNEPLATTTRTKRNRRLWKGL